MAKDWICRYCGCKYDYEKDEAEFEEKYDAQDWFILSIDGNICLKCASKKADDAIFREWEDLEDVNERTCETCGKQYVVGEAREELEICVMSKDPIGGAHDFDPYKCGDCNIEMYLDSREESYKSSCTGEYRTYEEYLESGEPIDPCDDALWLHDQE